MAKAYDRYSTDFDRASEELKRRTKDFSINQGLDLDKMFGEAKSKWLESNKDKFEQEDAQESLNKKLEERQAKQQDFAGRLKTQADDFRKNLPGYTGNQIAAAQDSSRANLVNDIQNIRQGANSRGLLYSGVKEGSENQARAQEGAKLASNIKNINQNAQSQADTKDEMATRAAQGAEESEIGMMQTKMQQAQTAYEQSLQIQQMQQQQQSDFWGDVIGAVGSVAGAVLNPVGGLIGKVFGKGK